jgi:serine/threonine protein phosphatase PrpC
MPFKVYTVSLGKDINIPIRQILESNVDLKLPYNDASFSDVYLEKTKKYTNEDTVEGTFEQYPLICADGVGGSSYPKIASTSLVKVFKNIHYNEVNPKHLLEKVSESIELMEYILDNNTSGSSTLLVVWSKKLNGKFRIKTFSIGDCKCYIVANNSIVYALPTGPSNVFPSDQKFHNSKYASFEENNILLYAKSSCIPIPNQIESRIESLDTPTVFYSFEEEFNSIEPSTMRKEILQSSFYSEYEIEGDNIQITLMSDGVYDNLSHFQLTDKIKENIVKSTNHMLIESVRNAYDSIDLLSKNKFYIFFFWLIEEFMKSFGDSKLDYSSNNEIVFVFDKLNDYLKREGLQVVKRFDQMPICNFYDAICIFNTIAIKYINTRSSRYREIVRYASYLFKFFSYRKKDDISLISAVHY